MTSQGGSPSFTTSKKMQKMPTSWEAPDSLSSLGILWSHWLHHHLSWVFMISLRSQRLHHHLMHLLGFCDLNDFIRWHLLGFYDLAEILKIASPPDASLGILWSQWLHQVASLGILWSSPLASPPTSPPLLGFYDHHHLSWDFMIITTCITTSLVILWSPPPASPPDAISEEMHQVVMQWVKSQNPKKCIRWWCMWWCTEWDHKIAGDASPGFLWFRWLHRHLMHFLIFVILLVASPLDVPSYMWGCHHPLTNAKVKRKGTMRYRTFR